MHSVDELQQLIIRLHVSAEASLRIDFLGLEAFLAIADRGSFHRAAAHLNLSQTALSHRIRKLEDDLGLKLLARTTRQVTLTGAGQELLPKARRLMEEMSVSLEELRLRGRERQAHVAIACLPTLASHVLPRILERFLTAFRDVQVRILDHSATEISEHVRVGDVEFGISILSSTEPDLELTPLFKEAFVLACRASDPLAAQASVTWQDIAQIPLIRVGALTGNRILIDDALGSRRESLLWRYEVRHIATAVNMVQTGLGMTVLPEGALAEGDASGMIGIPIRNPSVTRTIGILSRRDTPLSAPALALRDLIVQGLRSNDPPPARQKDKPMDE